MTLSMTLMEMLQQGSVVNLLFMGVIFCLIVFVLSKLDRFDKATDNNTRTNTQPALAVAHNTGDSSEVTAVISAAVNEYRKTK